MAPLRWLFHGRVVLAGAVAVALLAPASATARAPRGSAKHRPQAPSDAGVDAPTKASAKHSAAPSARRTFPTPPTRAARPKVTPFVRSHPDASTRRRRSSSPPKLERVGTGSCPAEMTLVSGAVGPYCVDRYEATIVDRITLEPGSPSYPPDAERAASLFEFWTEHLQARPTRGRWVGLELPPLTTVRTPMAVSQPGVTPQGYASGEMAHAACEAAGKRLCTEPEWENACMGQSHTSFPYGQAYEAGSCNVYRWTHPSFELHGNSSKFHRDPRLNLLSDDDGSLLRRTGETGTCASRWGDDAIYDMVGNVDEWVATPGGVFRGGFYARATKSGCRARVSTHEPGYLDYSTGFRCCADATSP